MQLPKNSKTPREIRMSAATIETTTSPQTIRMNQNINGWYEYSPRKVSGYKETRIAEAKRIGDGAGIGTYQVEECGGIATGAFEETTSFSYRKTGTWTLALPDGSRIETTYQAGDGMKWGQEYPGNTDRDGAELVEKNVTAWTKYDATGRTVSAWHYDRGEMVFTVGEPIRTINVPTRRADEPSKLVQANKDDMFTRFGKKVKSFLGMNMK